jgi:bifunctional non-homologous end joining protein LigD
MSESSKSDAAEVLTVDGREVRVTHPEKLYFSRQVRLTKLDLVRYYLAIAPGALQGIRDRPLVLKRFVNGAEAEAFYQKRAPTDHPAWLRTVTLSFPSGRTAEELVVDDPAGLAWIVNLGCIELHPHPVRSGDLDHPDEMRVDLDPGPGVTWADVQRVAVEVKAALEEAGLLGWPKTSGSRGMHINVRIEPKWSFTEVRRAALALSRAVERRVPALATSKWWKEERHGVFLDYNQNAKDRTTASAYSVRPVPDARVSAPLDWGEVADCDPAEFTVLTMPARFAKIGDPHAAMDSAAGSLNALLELAAKDEAEGLGDAPWPPHFRKMEGEGARVAPSRARKPGTKAAKKPREKAPLIVVANSAGKDEALAGLDRWKARHPEAARLLAVDDVLVDSMRGRSSTWTRIRINLRHVPEELRPADEKPDPDEAPGWNGPAKKRAKSA